MMVLRKNLTPHRGGCVVPHTRGALHGGRYGLHLDPLKPKRPCHGRTGYRTSSRAAQNVDEGLILRRPAQHKIDASRLKTAAVSVTPLHSKKGITVTPLYTRTRSRYDRAMETKDLYIYIVIEILFRASANGVTVTPLYLWGSNNANRSGAPGVHLQRYSVILCRRITPLHHIRVWHLILPLGILDWQSRTARDVARNSVES
jgi:hypothetical protein